LDFWFRLSSHGSFKLDIIKLQALHILWLLDELGHFFLDWKVEYSRIVKKW
jgi:hypothetical protein